MYFVRVWGVGVVCLLHGEDIPVPTRKGNTMTTNTQHTEELNSLGHPLKKHDARDTCYQECIDEAWVGSSYDDEYPYGEEGYDPNRDYETEYWEKREREIEAYLDFLTWVTYRSGEEVKRIIDLLGDDYDAEKAARLRASEKLRGSF